MIQRPEEVAARRGLPLEDVAPAGMLRARAAAAQGRGRDGHRTRARTGTARAATSDLLQVTQVRSAIGASRTSGPRCARSASRKIRQTVDRPDRPEIRGMIHTVRHLVTVEEVA